MATANAASGRANGGPPDIARWARSAAELDVDVLAVQEVDHLLERSGGLDQTAAIAAACAGEGAPWTARFAAAVHGPPGSAATMRPAPSTLADEPSYGIALLSRHPVREWHELRMEPSRFRLPIPLPFGGPTSLMVIPDEQRVALAGVVDSPDGPVTVVATHLSFAPMRAVAQLRELMDWAEDLPRPLVLLGDLNLPGALPANLTGWSPGVHGPTYPAVRPFMQLDHVLLDAGGSGASLRAGEVRKVGGSDHLALRAELVLPG